MKIGYHLGAMYAEIEDEEINIDPLELGDKIIYPGQYINKLGHKKRSMFEMQEGWYLKYVGRVEKYLLFDTNCDSENKNMFYCFLYIDKYTLLICGASGGSGCSDIRIQEIDVYNSVGMQQLDEQLSIF